MVMLSEVIEGLEYKDKLRVEAPLVISSHYSSLGPDVYVDDAMVEEADYNQDVLGIKDYFKYEEVIGEETIFWFYFEVAHNVAGRVVGYVTNAAGTRLSEHQLTLLADNTRVLEINGVELDDGPVPTTATEETAPQTDFEAKVRAITDGIADLLVRKNEAYGNSALDPIRVFSKLHPADAISVRIDDKLSRIREGNLGGDEDTVDDLIGYLVLYKIAKGS